MARAAITRQPAPTMRDVARVAGVSQATVSYVINGRSTGLSRISPETRDRVLAAMQALNYVPNEAARHLRRQRSDRICLVINRLGSPFGEELAAEVERIAGEHGYTVAIALGGSPEREAQVIEQVRRRMADGLIVESATSAASDLQRLATAGVPVVAMSNTLEPNGFDVVATTELAAVATATDALLASGHTRFGVLVHANTTDQVEARAVAVRDRLGSAGIALSPDNIVGGAESRTRAYRSVRELLARPDRPTALYSTSDTGAISALWAAYSLGLHVPADLAIVGTGNIAEGSITQPALSTIGAVHQPFAEIAEMLVQRLAGAAPSGGRRMVIPWTFFPRGTS